MSNEITYPVGYGTQRVTMADFKQRYEPRLHPEFAKRFFAFIEHKRGVIGVGGGWRTKPHPVSAASRAGRSFHQSQDWKSGEFYAAFDLVQTNPEPGGIHIAPRWSEVPVQGSQDADDFGVHMNVASESWHMQPVEIDGFLNWHWNGRPDLFMGYPSTLYGPQEPVPPQVPQFNPAMGFFSLWPLNPNKPRVAQKAFVTERVAKGYDNWTDRGDAVKYLQGVILHKAGGRIKVDGYYGPMSEARIVDLQKWFNLTVDGLVGPQVWGLIDALSAT